MKRLIVLSILLFTASVSYAAWSADTVWEVRPVNGSNANGGGFDWAKNGTGTDYSQQNSPHVVFDGATIYASTGATSKIINVTGYTTAATDVGNYVQITGGTNFLTGIYEITAQASGNWTLDRVCTGAGAASSMTGNMGGAFSTLYVLMASTAVLQGTNMRNVVYVKAEGTMVIESSMTLIAGLNGSPFSRLVGYTSTRGDGGRPTIQMSGSMGSPQVAIYSGAGNESIENFIIDCNNVATSTGIYQLSTASNFLMYNVKITNCTSGGVYLAGSGALYNSEVTGSGSGATGAVHNGSVSMVISRNWIHDNSTNGIYAPALIGPVIYNLLTNNTGASSDGIRFAGNSNEAIGNTIYGSGRHGISVNSTTSVNSRLKNNILANNGGYGIYFQTVQPANFGNDGNAFYLNSSGNKLGMDDTGSLYKVDASVPYTRIYDIDLTASPFVDPSSNDFRLNNVIGGGSSCKYSGTPGAVPGLTASGYMDMGMIQTKPTFGVGF
jgi:hypothetical protein